MRRAPSEFAGNTNENAHRPCLKVRHQICESISAFNNDDVRYRMRIDLTRTTRDKQGQFEVNQPLISDLQQVSGLSRREFVCAGGCVMLATTVPTPLKADNLVKLGGIYSAPVTHHWISRLHQASLNYVVRGEVDYRYVEGVRAEDFARVFRSLSGSGVELIVGDIFANEETARLIAKDFQNVSYLMGSNFQPSKNYSNFFVFDSFIQDASYLSGIIGGALSKSGKIGIVGRYSYPSINRLINAFISGVRELRSDLEFTVDFQNSWNSPERAAELTYAQIASGVDVIFADAPGVAAIASDSDIPVIGSFDGLIKTETDTIVTSARWHFEPTLHTALDQIRGHHVTGMDFGIYSYMRHGGCSLAPISVSADRIPEEAIERVAQREADMRSLRFTTNVNPQRPFSGLFPVFE